MSKWIHLLTLSFLTAVLGEVTFFVLIDPQQLYLFGDPVSWSPMVVYSVGFFMFWALTALTAFLVDLQEKTGEAVNRDARARTERLMHGSKLHPH